MFAYRPEKWDRLNDHTLARINGQKELASIYSLMMQRLRYAWSLLDRAGDVYRDLAIVNEREAFGLYNAMLIMTNNANDVDAHYDIYQVGHYSWFY